MPEPPLGSTQTRAGEQELRVSSLLGPPAPVVPSRLSVGYARKVAALKSATILLVEENERLVGVVETRDLDRSEDDRSIGACMRRLVLTLPPTATAARARELLVKHQLSALPVVAGMFVVGCVSREAIERALSHRANLPMFSVRAAA